MVKRILVTGSSGFIGSHCVEHILKNTDWEIVAMVRGTHIGDNNRLLDNEAIAPFLSRLKIVRVDLADGIPEHKDAQIGPIDYILHLAANSHVDRSIDHPLEFYEDNVTSTQKLFNWQIQRKKEGRGAEKIINCGTDEVFGPVKNGVPFKETDAFHPSNPYAAAKAGQVCAGFAAHVTHGLPIITTYMVNIFAERQNSEKLIPKTMKKLLKGEPMPIHCRIGEDGSISEVGIRCWMHARTAADAYLFLLQNGVVGEAYNVEAGVQRNNLEVVKLVAEYLGVEPKIEYIDFHKSRPGHDYAYGLDGTKIRALGWEQKVTFEEALKKTVEWTVAHPEWLN